MGDSESINFVLLVRSYLVSNYQVFLITVMYINSNLRIQTASFKSVVWIPVTKVPDQGYKSACPIFPISLTHNHSQQVRIPSPSTLHFTLLFLLSLESQSLAQWWNHFQTRKHLWQEEPEKAWQYRHMLPSMLTNGSLIASPIYILGISQSLFRACLSF